MRAKDGSGLEDDVAGVGVLNANVRSSELCAGTKRRRGEAREGWRREGRKVTRETEHSHVFPPNLNQLSPAARPEQPESR